MDQGRGRWSGGAPPDQYAQSGGQLLGSECGGHRDLHPFGGKQRGHCGGVDAHVVVGLGVDAGGGRGVTAGQPEGKVADVDGEQAARAQRSRAAAEAWPRARSSIAGEASVAMTRCPAAVSSLVSRPLPQPSSRTSPFRDRSESSSARIPGAHARAWKPKPRW